MLHINDVATSTKVKLQQIIYIIIHIHHVTGDMISFWFTADNPMLSDDWQNPEIIVIQVQMTSTLQFQILRCQRSETSLL